MLRSIVAASSILRLWRSRARTSAHRGATRTATLAASQRCSAPSPAVASSTKELSGKTPELSPAWESDHGQAEDQVAVTAEGVGGIRAVQEPGRKLLAVPRAELEEKKRVHKAAAIAKPVEEHKVSEEARRGDTYKRETCPAPPPEWPGPMEPSEDRPGARSDPQGAILKRKAQRRIRLPAVLTFATVGMFFASVASVWVAYEQRDVASRQWQAMKEANARTDRGVKVAEDNLILAERVAKSSDESTGRSSKAHPAEP